MKRSRRFDLILCDTAFCANYECHIRDKCLRSIEGDCTWRASAKFELEEDGKACMYFIPTKMYEGG